VHDILDAALQYQAAGWHVVPLHWIVGGGCSCAKRERCASPGKHTLVKWRDMPRPGPAEIQAWWAHWPLANVGILTGLRSGVGVLDVDGEAGIARLGALTTHLGAPLPRTLMAESGRIGGGRHAYYAVIGVTRNATAAGLDWRGDGGLVVAPPSVHRTGATYKWVGAGDVLAPLPAGLMEWFAAQGGGKRPPRERVLRTDLPVHLQSFQRPTADAARPKSLAALADIEAALAAIPNPDLGWEEWNTILMAAYAAGGTIEIAEAWSSKSSKHKEGSVKERWAAYAGCPPTELTFGSLVYLAREAVPGWEPPSQRAREVNTTSVPTDVNGHALFTEVHEESLSPLQKLNKDFAVISNIGGKCLVMTFDRKLPSFQSFKSFAERFANRYVVTKRVNSHGDSIEKAEQMGTHWLKWSGRRQYEGIDLEPTGELPEGWYNLWQGWGVPPAAGGWPRMRQHITKILAKGEEESVLYILRWAAWTVQHPGERAGVALVLRGGQGIGKGTFAQALLKMFGAHGLQIYNRAHFVGHFNAHLRNVLLLYADEAFWAGDKPAESILKGMLTEPGLVIEQKGVDVTTCKNRLHVIMATNSEWVVPASHDSRRYAVFDCAEELPGLGYFDALHREIESGGASAMLHDLLNVDLGGWHPREIVQTEGLRTQKELSLDPLQAWWLDVVESGYMPVKPMAGADGYIPFAGIYEKAKDEIGGHKISRKSVGNFLKKLKINKKHINNVRHLKLPTLKEARLWFETHHGKRDWGDNLQDWADFA